jgi:integral membrane protein (TIGR01906 family)
VSGRLRAFLIAAATALVILGASLLPFTTPAYVRLEQDRTDVGYLTGYSGGDLDRITNQILGDLFLWRGDFSVGDANLVPVLNEREQSHMRDVRGVFAGFELLVLASIVVLALALRRRADSDSRAAIWRAVGSGARGLVIALAVAGVFAVFAFDAAFDLFHRLFFSAGSYDFDPRTDRLVQLFPEQFWSETAIAVGVVAIVVAVLTALLAARRAGAARPAPVLSTLKART